MSSLQPSVLQLSYLITGHQIWGREGLKHNHTWFLWVFCFCFFGILAFCLCTEAKHNFYVTLRTFYDTLLFSHRKRDTPKLVGPYSISSVCTPKSHVGSCKAACGTFWRGFSPECPLRKHPTGISLRKQGRCQKSFLKRSDTQHLDKQVAWALAESLK